MDARRVLQVRFRSKQTPDGSLFSSRSLSCASFCASQLLPRLQLLPRWWSPEGGVTTATAHTALRVGVSHLRACLWLNVKAITVAAHGSLDNKMFTLGKIIARDVSVTQKPINMWLNRSGCNVSENINECNRGKKGVITAEGVLWCRILWQPYFRHSTQKCSIF